MSKIMGKDLFIKETKQSLEKMLVTLRKNASLEGEEAAAIRKQFFQMEREALRYGFKELSHLSRVSKSVFICDMNKYLLPQYLEGVLLSLIAEMMTLVEHPNEIKHRLPKVHDESIISLLRSFNVESGTKTVLIIDSDLLFLNKVSKVLSEAGFHVEKANRGRDGLEKIAKYCPDCIVINTVMTDIDGHAFIAELQKETCYSFVPIIVISNNQKLSGKLEGAKLGADDFLTKPFVMDELLIRLHRLIERNERIKKQTLLDELTGLYTRKYFLEKLNYYFQDSNESEFNHSVIIFDLDYFKQVNDRFGHAMGDKVLVTFANFISSHIRESDVFARYGGEEFILLFPRTTSEQALVRLDSIREKFSKININVGQETINQTFSGGIASKDDMNIERPEDLIKFADIALYEAKNSGRNQLLIYKNYMKSKKRSLKILIADDDAFIRKVLENELAEDGWELLFACDGKEALESAKENSPQLILLDVWMPIFNGYEILEKLRSDIQFKQTAVIMLTGNNSEKDVANALNMGADDYITKPVSMDELKARIKRLLRYQYQR
ncbi:response regulator [Anaerobacillus sp. MEB173]|uniref:response regulator n=1 Tax=Anaerobacillus sp. MEB173 TaxID=3383345 RepID=UPI003F93CB2C